MIFSREGKRPPVTWYWVRYRCKGGCGTHEAPGRHAEKAGTFRRQAEKLQRERLGEIEAGEYRDPRLAQVHGATFSELAERFLRDYASTRRSTYFPHRVALLRKTFGARELRSITRGELDAYLARRCGEVSAGSVRHEATVLAVMFRCAVRWEMLPASPAVGVARPPVPGYTTRYLTPEEFSRLETAAPPWLRPVLRLAVLTGLRLKELTNLRWEDWDRRAGVLVILPDRKIPTVHHVPVSVATRAFLEALPRKLADPHILPMRRSAALTAFGGRRYVSAATVAAANVAGLAGVSFRHLRHTAASWMVQAGVPLYEVQRILGHSTPAMTQRYAALAPGNLAKAVEALGRAIPPPADAEDAGA